MNRTKQIEFLTSLMQMRKALPDSHFGNLTENDIQVQINDMNDMPNAGISTMTTFLAAARQVMADNGIGENTCHTTCECNYSNHIDKVKMEYRISWFPNKGLYNCKQVNSEAPEIAIEKMKLAFKESELSNVKVNSPVDIAL